jgi:hypothetical protein
MAAATESSGAHLASLTRSMTIRFDQRFDQKFYQKRCDRHQPGHARGFDFAAGFHTGMSIPD